MSVEDELKLSSNSLAALQEFLQEREKLEAKFKRLDEQKEIDFNVFKEDWQLSQFWYSEDFATTLGELIISQTRSKNHVALISCPTAYFHMKSTKFKQLHTFDLNLSLFEFDRRFEKYSEFNFYDYNDPLNLNASMKSKFDLVCVDPPFLSAECWEKVIKTIEFVMKRNAKIIACTGLVMAPLLKEKLGLSALPIEVKHSNGLSNEFGCFGNFKL